MKGKIIAVVHPFDFKQNLYVYEGDELQMNVAVPLANLADTIIDVSFNHDIDRVVLYGHSQFLETMKNEILAKSIIQYGEGSQLDVVIESI
jgi:hypothetical protein